MVRNTLALAVALVLLGGGGAYAQNPQSGLGTPTVSAPSGGVTATLGFPFAAPPLKYDSPHAVYDIYPPGPPAVVPFQDTNGPLLVGDPLLDSPSWAPPGWFAGVEVGAFDPHIKNRMNQNVGSSQDLVHLPTPLDWTVSPIIQLGYRFGEGAGELLLSYQFLVPSGSGTIANFDTAGNAGALRSQLEVHVVDLEYGTREFSLGPVCDMKWLAGIRWATTDFHTNAESGLQQESISNNYWGIGPVFGLNLAHFFTSTGWDVFCRSDCAALYGPITQGFEESFATGTDPGGVLRQQHNQFVIVPRVEIGCGWTPSWNSCWHFAAGYSAQVWFDMENDSNGPVSRGDLTVQGIFVHAEWKY